MANTLEFWHVPSYAIDYRSVFSLPAASVGTAGGGGSPVQTQSHSNSTSAVGTGNRVAPFPPGFASSPSSPSPALLEEGRAYSGGGVGPQKEGQQARSQEGVEMLSPVAATTSSTGLVRRTPQSRPNSGSSASGSDSRPNSGGTSSGMGSRPNSWGSVSRGASDDDVGRGSEGSLASVGSTGSAPGGSGATTAAAVAVSGSKAVGFGLGAESAQSAQPVEQQGSGGGAVTLNPMLHVGAGAGGTEVENEK